MLLADRVLLMSNGPRARIAEIVVNTLPADRTLAAEGYVRPVETTGRISVWIASHNESSQGILSATNSTT